MTIRAMTEPTLCRWRRLRRRALRMTAATAKTIRQSTAAPVAISTSATRPRPLIRTATAMGPSERRRGTGTAGAAALPERGGAGSSVAGRDFLPPVCHHTIAAPTSAAATQRLAGLGQMCAEERATSPAKPSSATPTRSHGWSRWFLIASPAISPRRRRPASQPGGDARIPIPPASDARRSDAVDVVEVEVAAKAALNAASQRPSFRRDSRQGSAPWGMVSWSRHRVSRSSVDSGCAGDLGRCRHPRDDRSSTRASGEEFDEPDRPAFPRAGSRPAGRVDQAEHPSPGGMPIASRPLSAWMPECASRAAVRWQNG